MILILVPVLLFLAYEYQELKLTRQQTSERIQRVLSMQHRVIDDWFDRQSSQIRILAGSRSVKNLDQHGMIYDFNLFLEQQKDFDAVVYVNRQGVTEVHTSDIPGIDVSDREYFQAALQGRSYVTDVITGRSLGWHIIIFSSPVVDFNGDFQGLVFGAVRLAAINRLMEQFKFGETGETYLVNRDGLMITESRFKDQLVEQGVIMDTSRLQMKVDTPGFRNALEQVAGFSIYDNYMGDKVLGSYQWIGLPQWVIIGEMGAREFLEPFYKQLRFIMTAMLLIMLIAVPLVLVIYRRIDRPVQSLIEGSREIQQGNYQYVIDKTEVSRSPRELQELCEAFNGMVGTIRKHIDLLNSTNRALTEAETKYRTLVENSLVGVYIIQDGRFVYANPRLLEIHGYNHDELMSLSSYLDAIHPDDRPMVKENVRRRLGGEITSIGYQFRVLRKDGRMIYVEVFGGSCDFEGKPTIIGTMMDVTRRNKAREALRESEERFRTLVNSMDDMVYTLDVRGRYADIYGNWAERLGMSPGQFIGKTPAEIFGSDIHEGAREQVLTGQNAVYEWSLKGDSGRRYFQTSLSPIMDAQQKIVGIVAVGRDITQLKEMEEQLKNIGLRDPLTGLYNRTYFQEEMRRLQGGRFAPVGIVVCDLDGLKLINDTMGHPMGDALLLSAAGVLRQCFRDSDVVARIGGDEFAVLLPESDRWVVEEAYNRIRRMVERHNAASPKLPLGISVGYAVSNESVRMEELFREADDGMYRDKLKNRPLARKRIINMLLCELEAKGYVYSGHMERVREISTALGRAVGLSRDNIEDLGLAAIYHDIGKIGVAEDILIKPGPLTADEMLEVQRHCEIGYRIAREVPDLVHVADWILKHHERWDGTGYPLGLRGEEIPLECRIMAIADAYEAMTNQRPYRRALTGEEALAELSRCAGTQFDPDLVREFLKLAESDNI